MDQRAAEIRVQGVYYPQLLREEVEEGEENQYGWWFEVWECSVLKDLAYFVAC